MRLQIYVPRDMEIDHPGTFSGDNVSLVLRSVFRHYSLKDFFMNRSRLTLIDVLQPRSYSTTPERSRVTRTIVQPEIDSFEQMEAQQGAMKKSAVAGRQGGRSEQQAAA